MRLSLSTGITLLAVGLILAFAVNSPDGLADYIDTVDLGLVLVWTGVLHLAVTAYVHRPPRRRPTRRQEGLVAPHAAYEPRVTRVMPSAHRQPPPILGPDDTPTQVLGPDDTGHRRGYDPRGY